MTDPALQQAEYELLKEEARESKEQFLNGALDLLLLLGKDEGSLPDDLRKLCKDVLACQNCEGALRYLNDFAVTHPGWLEENEE